MSLELPKLNSNEDFSVASFAPQELANMGLLAFGVVIILWILGVMIDKSHDDRMGRRIRDYESSRGRPWG